jgi:hypothetical protein
MMWKTEARGGRPMAIMMLRGCPSAIKKKGQLPQRRKVGNPSCTHKEKGADEVRAFFRKSCTFRLTRRAQ